MRRLAAFLLVLTCCLTASCGGSTAAGDQEALPHATLSDWATYGDLAVTVTITGERRVPMTAEEQARGEGLEVRVVTLWLGERSWVRPGAPHEPSPSMTMANGGWMINTTLGVRTERRILLDGQPAVLVGHRYLALLTRTDITAIVDPSTRTVIPGAGPDWVILDLVPLTNGAAALPAGRDTPALRAIAGRTPRDVGALLRATAPDPAAARYMDLDPVVRHQYAQADRQPR